MPSQSRNPCSLHSGVWAISTSGCGFSAMMLLHRLSLQSEMLFHLSLRNIIFIISSAGVPSLLSDPCSFLETLPKKNYVFVWLPWVLVVGRMFVALCRISHCGSRAAVVATKTQLLQDMRDLSSPIRDGTCVPCMARRILKHQTPGEVLETLDF